jgi:hypothetical protein
MEKNSKMMRRAAEPGWLSSISRIPGFFNLRRMLTPAFRFFKSKTASFMKMSFLDYYKLILQKVSFDPVLLKKEYRKAVQRLKPEEAEQLRKWLRQKPFYRLMHPNEYNSAVKP